jgi:hypothetical protein
MSQGFTKGTPIDTDPTLSLNSDIVVPSQKAVKTYVDGGLSDKVNRSGDTMSGFLVLNANPLVPLGAATKDYVDTLINGIDWKQAADAGTVAALPTYAVTGSGQTLTGTTNGAIPSATTDNVTLTLNQRVLVKNETLTLTPNNGIYVVTQVGSALLPFILTRSSDANTSALIAEATLSVKAGTTLANTQWHCNPAAIPVVIGTTYITFAQIGGGTYTFSPPLSVAGNIVSIPVATSLVDGYLSAADWTIFNGKVPSTRTLTINGTTYDLSADRSWTIAAGISGSGTTNEIAYFTAASTLSSLTTVTYPSLTELSYVKGVTSAIQTQINGKQNTIGLTTVGTNLATLPDPSAIRYLRINADNTVSAISLAQLKTDLSAVSVQYSLVTTNQTNVGTTFENVTELSFAVTANKTYRWSATISFTVVTGFIMFSTNGPTASFATSRFMWSSTTVTTNTITNQVAYDSGTNAVAASNAVCTGDGLFRVTASGTWTIRFRCASAASLTVRAGSLVEYQEVL